MQQVQQDLMCALLRSLLDKELITQAVHDKSREKIFGMLDWPEFFCHTENAAQEKLHGSA